MTGTVVIFAQEADAPVDAVVRELSARLVEVFRADTSWFPQRLTLDARIDTDGHWSGVLATDQHQVGLEEIGAIWYRDPGAFRFPDALPGAERAYAHREARLGLGGVLAALPVLWVNHPNRGFADHVQPALVESLVVRHRADVGEYLEVGHLPALGDVPHAVGPVGGEQRRRVTLRPRCRVPTPGRTPPAHRAVAPDGFGRTDRAS